MGAFTWVIVCAVVILYDAGTHVMSANSADDIGLAEGKELDQNFLEEGRKMKKHKRKIVNMVIAMKIVALSLIIPKILALTLFASWKGITLSLIALAVACVSAWKHPHHDGRGEKTHAHFLEKKDDHAQIHQHWWRKIREAEPIYDDEDYYVGPYHGHHNDYKYRE